MIETCSKYHSVIAYEDMIYNEKTLKMELRSCPICDQLKQTHEFYKKIIDKYAIKEMKEELALLRILEASDE